jgi:uncharacterized membrane protein (DUF106 family)
MDALLDAIWYKIVTGIHHLKDLLDFIFGPLNTLGPAVAILLIALVTVVITKSLSKVFKTRRYRELQQEFRHWFNIRQEAMNCDDPEKSRLLAKNIDQAKLNKVYYDYFFEGLLNNIVTKYLPILLLLAYVNETYQPANLRKLFGREYVFKLGQIGEHTLFMGSIFWFLISIVLVYLVIFSCKKALKIKGASVVA